MLQNKRIEKKELPDYENQIPDAYMDLLKTGKLYAGLIYHAAGGEEIPEAVYITYSLEDWQVLVWLKYFREKVLPMERARLLRYLLRTENLRNQNRLKGAFLEIHIDELEDPDEFRYSLMMSGFECRVTYDNLYEFSLEQVKEKEFLKKAAKSLTCRAVSAADPALLVACESMVQKDDRPVPVDLYLNWNDYISEDSLICVNAGEPCGMLLFSRKGEYLVIACAYTAHKTALAAMLGNAFLRLEKKYGPGQKILVPVVLNRTGMIVERMVPGAVRGKMLEGVYWF